LADRLGCRATLFPGWDEPIDAFREWAKVSAGRLCDYSGITYDMLDDFGGVQWPCAAGSDEVALGGTPRCTETRSSRLLTDARSSGASNQSHCASHRAVSFRSC
jgi:assimilatory nitrate reductase catalytic subunit